MLVLVLLVEERRGLERNLPVEGVGDVAPCDVGMIPVLLQPDPVSYILSLSILDELHGCPFPVVGMPRVLI